MLLTANRRSLYERLSAPGQQACCCAPSIQLFHYRSLACTLFLSVVHKLQKKTVQPPWNGSIDLEQLPHFLIFTALHAMQTRSSDENSVCPSVCPSVKRVLCDQTVERSVQIYTPYERTFSLVFWEEEWLVGGHPFYLKFWVNRPPLEQNRRFWTDNRS